MYNCGRALVRRTISTKYIVVSSRCLSRSAVLPAAKANEAVNPEVKHASNTKRPEGKEKVSTPKESTSFIMNLFRGVVNTDQIFPYPDVMTDDQRETLTTLIDPVEKFFSEVNDSAENDANEVVSEKSLAGLWELGAFGLQVPQELGGLGLTNTQYARLVEIVGANDLGVAITLGSHQSIGFKGILLFGTPEQKEKYLPRVASGKVYAAFCLTEPTAGSDAGSIRSKAVLSADGTHYVLNGSKLWISNGGIAEIMTVFAQVPMKDKTTGETVNKVTAFVVERSFGGVTNGPPEKKMGIKASNTCEVFFEDVKIPIENVLGEVGGGFKVAMTILNNGRFGMGAALSGTMRNVTETALAFATQRTQFGKKISSFGAIQEKFARMAMLHYVTETMAYVVAGNMDAGAVDYQLEAAVSKVFASESAWYVTDEAIQVMGGMGYMRSAGLERVMRDLRIFRIFEGTNDILRLFIALTGIQYAGAHLRELQMAFKNPAANLGLIFEEATSRLIRSVGLSSPRSLKHLVDVSLTPSMAQANRCIDLFGEAVEKALFKEGKKMVDQQFALNRIAASAIDIYSMMCTLSRCTRSIQTNSPSAEYERHITQVWCNEAYDRIRKNLRFSESRHVNEYKKMGNIAELMYEHGGFPQKNPVGL